jgi:hypothetical protein
MTTKRGWRWRDPRFLLLCRRSLLLLLLWAPPPSIAATALRPHTVSGFSSGANLAINHGIAFSQTVGGIGVLGGSPYGCNVLPDPSDEGDTCSYWTPNSTVSRQWLAQCGKYLSERAAAGLVDGLEHLRGKPVYLFSGTRDSMVWQRTMRAVDEQFVDLGARVRSVFDIAANHAWIVDNVTCDRPNVPVNTGGPAGTASTVACCGAHPDLFGMCVLPNTTSLPAAAAAAAAASQQRARVAAGDDSAPTSPVLLPVPAATTWQHGCCGACAAGFCEPGLDCPPGVPPTPVDGPPW